MELIDGYEGVSGKCTFDEYGDRAGADCDVWVFRMEGLDCVIDVLRARNRSNKSPFF